VTTVRPVRRDRTIAVVALAAAVLGGIVALLAAAATGLTDRKTTTVYVPTTASGAGNNEPIVRETPIGGKPFDPARIYAARATGVVTIFAFFDNADEQAAQGTGFVVTPSGYILTSAHVVTDVAQSAHPSEAHDVYIAFKDGDRVKAEILGWDGYDDVALLKVDPAAHRLASVPLGDSSRVRPGDPVAAMGSPFGNEDSIAVGVVSAIHRSISSLTSSYKVVDAIQTDAPITHGNSGGPLFDALGRLIGINAQIRSQSGTGNDSGVGFAVPIDAAKRSVAQLVKTGHVRYAYVGITTQDLTPALAQVLGYSVKQGALVEDVRPNGPGARAGLRPSTRPVNALGYRDLCTGGDVVVSIDGQPVRNADDLVRIVSFGLQPGAVSVFTIVRDGRRKTVAVTLGDRDKAPAAVRSGVCGA
jgi:S1-C subfamily serine protease